MCRTSTDIDARINFSSDSLLMLLQDMAVRGAPAIAISAALGLAVELVNHGGGSQFSTAKEAQETIEANLDFLVTR